MKVCIFFLPTRTKEIFDVAVVIDVLRATTTLLFAVSAGAKEIIPAASIAHARRIKKLLGEKSALLCGERKGKKIPGFDLGNSPSEYSVNKVKDKTLIYASTNGSASMLFAQNIATKVILASLRNLDAVVKYIKEIEPNNVALVCSGKEGSPSLEDAYCAGILLNRLEGAEFCNDECYFVLSLARHFKGDAYSVLKKSSHGKYLIEQLGFIEDVELASQLDVDNIVPVLKDGRVTV